MLSHIENALIPIRDLVKVKGGLREFFFGDYVFGTGTGRFAPTTSLISRSTSPIFVLLAMSMSTFLDIFNAGIVAEVLDSEDGSKNNDELVAMTPEDDLTPRMRVGEATRTP